MLARYLTICYFFIYACLVSAQGFYKDTRVTLRLINSQTGNVFSGIETAFTVSSTDYTLINNNISDTIVTTSLEGSIDLQLIKDISYRASVVFLKQGVPLNNGFSHVDGVYYLVPRETVLFTPPSTQRNFVDFFLTPAKALLDVQVVDDTGQSVSSGYVQAYSAGTDKPHWVGDPVVNGKVTLPVLTDRSYKVNFNSPVNNLVVAGDSNINIAKGVPRYVLKIPLIKAKHEIGVRVTIDGREVQSDSVSFFFCSGYDQEGRVTSAESDDNKKLNLYVNNDIGSIWKVSCQVSTKVGDEQRHYVGETDYTVSGSLGSLTIPLLEDEDFFPANEYKFSGGSEVAIKTPDDLTIFSFPPYAIAPTGDIRVVLETGKGYVRTIDSNPVLAYDIKIFLNGNPVNRIGQPVLMSLPVDPDEIESLGATIDDVYPATYDEVSRQWIRETNYTYDESSSTLKVYVSHFSIWGALVDLTARLKASIPTNLRVRMSSGGNGDQGKQTVRMYWDAEDNATNGQYILEIARRKREVLRSKQNKPSRKQYRYVIDWTTAKVVRVATKRGRIRLSAGSYQFRVKLGDSGNYSEPKQFRVL
jgi:hypothetical protein